VVVSVVDNNCIDREVHKFKPTHVFIEALWVVPSKFHVLLKLHPKIKWFVRVHSKIPFIANEGVAIEWLREYDKISKHHTNFYISANNFDIVETFNHAYNIKVEYYPNIYYPPDYGHKAKTHFNTKVLDIGCFGAIRPMKNQLAQAMAAMAFGNNHKKKVRFHINSNRVEQRGDPVLKNLEQAFKNTPHELVKHPWVSHKEFVDLVRKMDMGMQVSLSETFNIVAADFVWNNIPVIGSNEISWLAFLYKTEPTGIHKLMHHLCIAYHGIKWNLQSINLDKLIAYNEGATNVWLDSI